MRLWERRWCHVFALVLLLVLRTALADGSEEPFPVAKSAILRGAGTIYFVEGEQTIPKGVEVSVQRGVRIVGRGEGAVLRVEGTLVMQGTLGSEIEVKDLDLVLAPKFQQVRTGYCDFLSSNILTAEGGSSAGKLQIENALVTGGSRIELTFHEGVIRLLGLSALLPTKIVCVPPEGGSESQVEVWASNCFQSTAAAGITGGLSVTGAAKLSIRTCRIAGELASFRDCRAITFDSNRIDSKRFELLAGRPEELGSLKITKCDIYSRSVVLRAAKGDSSVIARILFDRCYWGGLLDPRKILEEVVTDGDDESDNATRARIGKIQKRPVGLAGLPERMGGPR